MRSISIKISILVTTLVVLSMLMMSCKNDGSAKKLRILILSGRNNHEWQKTTPALKEIYEKCGRFVVQVTNSPESCTADSLAKFDVIVSNWCAWPEVTGQRWGAETEKAFLDFVRSGKGFVLFHAASATHQDWPEFQQLIGATWQEGVTGHGRIHTFKVDVVDKSHPVTRGMSSFWIKDELWHNVRTQPDIHVLCNAFSSPAEKGTGEFEPVVIYTNFSNGRCFYNVLGHNVETQQNIAWQTLMLRGTEWAATGRVTIPIPSDWPASVPFARDVKVVERKFCWLRSDTTLALLNRDQPVWKLNYKKLGKPYFDPLATVDGVPLTWNSPPDHAWHHALWFSWKEINGLNYWEEDRQTGLAKGLTEVQDVRIVTPNDFSAMIEMNLSYHPPGQEPVLTENRSLQISTPDQNGNYHVDWKSIFTAGPEKVVLEREPIEGQPGGRRWGGYATLACRVNTESLKNISFTDSEGRIDLDIHTKPTAWVDVSGALASDSTRTAGITIFDHPDNLRHPPSGYVIKTWDEKHHLLFAYMNPGFLYRDGFTLAANESLMLRYRILVHKGGCDRKYLQNVFSEFASI